MVCSPFPVMGSLWHCFTGFTPMSDNCRIFFLRILHKKNRPRAQVSPRSSPHHLTLPQHRREEFALPWPGPVIMAGKTRTQWLVFEPPLWKMMDFVSWDDDMPNMMGKIKAMFQTTNQMVMFIGFKALFTSSMYTYIYIYLPEILVKTK